MWEILRMKSETFEVDGKTYSVRLPNAREREEGERIHNRVFAYALKTGGLLEGQIMSVAREHGLWNEEKEAEVKAIREELAEKERVLDEGGIELDEAKAIAVHMKELRTKLLIYNLMLEELRSESVSRKADNAQVEYFVSRCTLCDGKQVYKDLDDYYLQQNTPLAASAMVAFSKLWYNFNADAFKFPEDQFMEEYFKDEVVPTIVEKQKKPFLKNGKPVEPVA